jgi:putative ABC transport system permease protein
MLSLALKMLMRDRVKYLMLVSGIALCTTLMTQQASVFCGLMMWTTGTVRNIAAPIWVMDAKVERADDVVPMRSVEVDRVRSVDGVAWAVPLFWSITQARLEDGSFQSLQLVGLDAATLMGRPPEMTSGSLTDLRLPNAVVVDQVAVEKFAKKGLTLTIGTVFEINDVQARVVGIARTARSFLGQPYVYTTYDRALEYTPPQRKRLSYVIAGPADGVSAETVAARISKLPGLRARAANDFFWETLFWYVRNTGIPISFGTTVVLGAIVGMAIAGQTFYLFVYENMRYLAAFKAMGCRTHLLAAMVLLQAFFVGFLGDGLGTGLGAMFGNAVVDAGAPPVHVPWQLPAFTAVVIFLVSLLASLIGLYKVARLEAAVVFR